MNQKTGIIIKGINNIYTVLSGESKYLCRIKGKILREDEKTYNPLAPGDQVKFLCTADSEGLITERLKRSSEFIRWNMKRNLPQILAANIDEVACIVSPDNPPFRPRFIDRVIVCAGKIPVCIVMNKCEIPLSEGSDRRYKHYQKLGYTILSVSAHTGTGIDNLEAYIKGKTVAFVGQSGVGKSTLINKLIPNVNQKTGEISSKYNRGRHVTNHAFLLSSGDITVVDTPGVRELQVSLMDLFELGGYYPEIAGLQNACSFQPCLHRNEPDCAIISAVAAGNILKDRYESYLRVLNSIEERSNVY
ncbi:MAG: ribosome small subunit-dependent GTPase A [Spirochaetales bacterium]|nr:ribosome small subunit-dependent GTPase A [Spirochaetales bacterium]